MDYNPYTESGYGDRNTTNINYLRGSIKTGVKKVMEEGVSEKEIDVVVEKAKEEAKELADK
jgi:hypothetical protein